MVAAHVDEFAAKTELVSLTRKKFEI